MISLKIKDGKLVNTSLDTDTQFVSNLTRDICKELGLNSLEFIGLLSYLNYWVYYSSNNKLPRSVFYKGQRLGYFKLSLEGFQELYVELKSRGV